MSQNIHHLNGGNGPQMGPGRRHDGHPNLPPQGPPGGHFQVYPVVPPAPPRVSIPLDLRGGSTIQISDVREDLMSESDMKEELSDYVIVRFEKVTDKDEIDEHGRPKWPSWEQAIRTDDWSISKKEATRKVRQLNATSKSVLDKKNSLTPPLKRQIDRTQEDLMRMEPDVANYEWKLVQIDHQLRAIDPYYASSLTGSLNYQPAHTSTTATATRATASSTTTSSTTATTTNTPRPPITLLVMAVGENVIFDPSKEELAVADCALAVSVGEGAEETETTMEVEVDVKARTLRLLSVRTIDPPSRLTAPGVPNAVNAAAWGQQQGSAVPAAAKETTTTTTTTTGLRAAETGSVEGVWKAPRGGSKIAIISTIVEKILQKGGVTDEVLEGLDGVELA
ncbi:hypothetical protein CIB48_g6335 [Xylaria polymorpha]|nr:hypothetical protein CIB48_g6335 [Xylaria polymorpha]